MRLGERKYSITVKQIDGKDTLRTVFRDLLQDARLRPHPSTERLDECYIFQRFARHEPPPRWVLVRDVSRVDQAWGRAIVKRGSDRGYSATLAVPLRRPVTLRGPASTVFSQLVGFLSVDCPDPNGFDGLFDLKPGESEPGLHGEKFQPHDDLELFFGLADSVATILVLQGMPNPSVSEEGTSAKA